MIKRLTSSEMRDTLNQFIECYDSVIVKCTDTEKNVVESFIEQISLMIPCYSMRPDKMQSLNDSIFNDSVITQFILDLSFRFYTLIGDADFLEKLISNLEDGLTIDGIDTDKNIIPLSIAQSCPSNIFEELNIQKVWWRKYLKTKNRNHLRDFLINNKHIVVVYLLYLSNQE